jgi:hypothetical protein
MCADVEIWIVQDTVQPGLGLLDCLTSRLIHVELDAIARQQLRYDAHKFDLAELLAGTVRERQID